LYNKDISTCICKTLYLHFRKFK